MSAPGHGPYAGTRPGTSGSWNVVRGRDDETLLVELHRDRAIDEAQALIDATGEPHYCEHEDGLQRIDVD